MRDDSGRSSDSDSLVVDAGSLLSGSTVGCSGAGCAVTDSPAEVSSVSLPLASVSDATVASGGDAVEAGCSIGTGSGAGCAGVLPITGSAELTGVEGGA